MVSALYIHIPFCVSKCRYCSFSSFAGLNGLYDRYLLNVKKEMDQISAGCCKKMELQTVFLGGGTPTVLDPERLVNLLDHAEKLFGFAFDAEISVEANPGTVDGRALELLRQGGFDRLSLGVQSFSADELAMLGRCHSPMEADAAFKAARSAGFTNISLDLMYGLPGQTIESWRTTLITALTLEPEHLSMYQLTVEEGTPFGDLLASGKLELPDEDTVVAMDELNLELCGEAGLEMYEISNFSRPGYRCRHNINYWQNNEYHAAGAGAVSFSSGVREKRFDDPREYCRRVEAGDTVITEREELTLEASFRETVVMGLRMMDGVERECLVARFGLDPERYYGEVLEKLVAQQLVELTPTHLKVTPAGRLYSNIILAELV
ncbi:radical SAM family heme chaperone HemW [Desulfopila aestuarii]|uniref:Heme chaperone HemW n=1 Tax=Desulfopila aestuarii DSM 18488 TaxID=1121416 RepID=A0A1M7XWA4_9BACT|nr:radical SAM family heme chaperone HemW [Desulfopila aestuarii]SHO43020.1 oxygen-independent coproporphyrinogen-3 oxidase [Desulfopila aestuarii DSM 18488]